MNNKRYPSDAPERRREYDKKYLGSRFRIVAYTEEATYKAFIACKRKHALTNGGVIEKLIKERKGE